MPDARVLSFNRSAERFLFPRCVLTAQVAAGLISLGSFAEAQVSAERKELPYRGVPDGRLAVETPGERRLSVTKLRETRLDSAPTPEVRGFYPTETEWDKIGSYYPRIRRDLAGGDPSDPRTQAPSGLWPYPTADTGHFQLLPSAVDPFLGLVTPPGGGVHVQGSNPTAGGGFTLGADAPYLTRAFNPERATFKLGLMYVDVLALSAGLLYSDFQGDREFSDDVKDGWLSVVSMHLRVVVPLTQNIYLSAEGEIYYLPGTNRFGVSVGDSGGLGFGAGVRVAYEKYVNGWWVSASDTVGFVNELSDLTDRVSVDEIDIAGRYRFGRGEEIGSRDTDFLDEDRLLFGNRAAITAIGPLSSSWRLEVNLSRSDFYPLDSDQDNYSFMEASTVAQYEGQDWRFAPFVGMRSSTRDDFERFQHEVFAGVRGPITQRLRLFSRVGYTFATGSERDDEEAVLYELGFVHAVGPYTEQSLSGGQVVDYSSTGDTRVGRYIRYSLNQRLSSRVDASFFTQISNAKNTDSGITGTTRTIGGTIGANITDFIRLDLLQAYDQFDDEDGSDSERLVLSARLGRRIAPGLFANLLYRFEDVETDEAGSSFTEHLYMMNITKQF